MKTILIGRTSPRDAMIIGDEKIGDVRVYTITLTYNETYADVPDELLEKIAKHYGKSKEKLSDEEIEEYLLEVLKINEKVKDPVHYFYRDW